MRIIGIFFLLASAAGGEEVSEQLRGATDTAAESSTYGLDVSFPVHGTVQMENNPLGDRHQAYLDHLEGCRRAYPDGKCDRYEDQRMLMNRRQPMSMEVRKY